MEKERWSMFTNPYSFLMDCIYSCDFDGVKIILENPGIKISSEKLDKAYNTAMRLSFYDTRIIDYLKGIIFK